MANADKTFTKEKERAIKQRTALETARYRFFLSNRALVLLPVSADGMPHFCVGRADRNLLPSSHHISNLIFSTHHRNFVFQYGGGSFFQSFFPAIPADYPASLSMCGFSRYLPPAAHVPYPVRLMNLGGLTASSHPMHASFQAVLLSSLIHQINRLIRQETVIDITGR